MESQIMPDVRSEALWQRPMFWRVLALLLIIPAIFTNLGLVPLDVRSDEARRALVSLEMMLSDNYITPTLNGVPYLNKPPLYNWIIVASYKMFGNFSPFALRFPMAVSLLGFAFTIYAFVRRHVARKRSEQVGSKKRYIDRPMAQAVAFATALMLITNARVLFYDSLLGLIDITYSWVMYMACMYVYHLDRRKNYVVMYLIAYSLTAVAFLMKGLTAPLLLGLTLLAWYGYTGRWQLLFHPGHVLGIGAFGVIVGLYYSAYLNENRVPLTDVLGVLLHESTKRTWLGQGLWATLRHFATFPFEFFYHFLPWTLMLVLMRTGWRDRLDDGDRFVLFNALLFAANVAVFWLSAQVYARYLIVLLPSVFTVMAFIYYRTDLSDKRRQLLEIIWLVALGAAVLAPFATLWYPATKNLPDIVTKAALIAAVLGVLTFCYVRQPANRLVILCVAALVARLGFDMFFLPPRVTMRQYYKDQAENVAKLSLGRPLYADARTFNYEGTTDVSSFHISAARGEILRKTAERDTSAYYLADSASLRGQQYRQVGEVMLFDKHKAYLVQYLK